MELKDKVAVVTGGGTGLGREISLDLAREGAHVVVIYSRSEKEAAATVADLQKLGSKAAAVKADVSKGSEVTSLIEKVMGDYGRIDVLVNTAGTTVFVDFSDLEGISEADWDKIMATNVKGPWMLAKAVAPIMKRQGRGSIIQTTSVAGLLAGGSSLAYTVSKAAETQLTRGLAMALAPEITVNAIAPGLLATRWGMARGEAVLTNTAAVALLKKLPTVEDCSAAVLMMIKNDSMTGQSIVVDAGRHFH
jgi:3-oxoacyl-[acyl-carrier protein] reductase